MHLVRLAVVLLLVLSGCDAAERAYALQALPPAVGAETVVFSRSETFGFGPGGNESGFAVITLGKEGAAQVTRGGIDWLEAQVGGRIRPDWSATPVPHDESWMGRTDSAAGAYPAPTVLAVLNRYGFGVDIPEEHRAALDTALNAPGSFYAFGSGGLVVVIVPRAQRAYVFYAG